MRTALEMIEKSLVGLAKQGWKQSTIQDPKVRCAYRGNDGCKCAIGQLIPDEFYLTVMDHKLNNGISHVAKHIAIKFRTAKGIVLAEELNTHSAALAHLQYWHDNIMKEMDSPRGVRAWEGLQNTMMLQYQMEIKSKEHYERLANDRD